MYACPKKKYLAKDLLIDSEGEVQNILDVIILHPLQTLVELLIQVLQVTEVSCSDDEKQPS